MKWLFFLLLLVISLALLLAAAPGEEVSAQLPVLDNIARDRPAFCSSIEDTCALCRCASDGDFTTRWSSQFSDPQWMYVDLGAPQRIERVILRWETAYGQAYRIQTSNDASAWTDIYSTTAGDGEVDNPAVSGTGRYLRMYSTQPPTHTPTPTQNAADANAYGYPDAEAHAHDHAGADRHFHSLLWFFRLR